MSQTVLILGARGRFGRTASLAFEQAGWNVRRFDRARDDLAAAAWGADVIVNAWNPPYPRWATEVPDMTASVIEVASMTGATVILPGNVYVFGPDMPDCLGSGTPHNARNPLGRVRIDMEAAYRASSVRTVILRAGDFIDTQASGNWFDKILINALGKGVFTYPGNPQIAHAWAFLPDLCRAAVQLAQRRDDLPKFADLSFPGYTLTGHDLCAALGRVQGSPVRLKEMSWLPLGLARPFWPMAGALLEMRYLWNTPHCLDGSDLAALLPDFRATPIDAGLRQAVPGSSVKLQIDPDQAVPAGQ